VRVENAARRGRWLWRAALSFALAVQVFLAGASARAGAPTCFGLRPTIVQLRSGRTVEGTGHADVIVAGRAPTGRRPRRHRPNLLERRPRRHGRIRCGSDRARTLRGSVPADLVALVVAHVIDVAPAGDPENWDAVGLRYGAADPVVEELAARAEGNLSAEQWSRLVEICRQLVVGHPQTSAALAERVLCPWPTTTSRSRSVILASPAPTTGG
jgi:hypothetical protein